MIPDGTKAEGETRNGTRPRFLSFRALFRIEACRSWSQSSGPAMRSQRRKRSLSDSSPSDTMDGWMRITLERDPKLSTRGWTKNREASPLLSFSASPREFVHRRAYEQGFRSSVYDAFVKHRRWKGIFKRGLRIKASLRDDAREGMKKKKKVTRNFLFSFRWVGKGRPRKVAREERSGGNVWNIQADAYKPRLEFSIASFALLWPRAERGSHVCGKIQTWPGGTRGYKKGEREASTGEVAIVSMERVE